MDRPYVISWNLTYRCNLACEHCYLDAGGDPKVETPAFADRRELTTVQCFDIIEQIAEFAPECVLILTGGEPLLRRDIVEIIERAAKRNLWVVIGTNGVKVSKTLAVRIRDCGARGFALSLDALRPERHDAFRLVKGAWENTVQGAGILRELGVPFIIQTTVGKHNLGELEEIAEFAYTTVGATVWNLYFLVQTGRGQFVSDISSEEYEAVLLTLSTLQKRYADRMMVNAKCAPHFARTLFEEDRTSRFLKAFSGGAGGCPAGTHYMGIRPNGDMTPCPYLPVFGGNLKERSFGEIWRESEVFTKIRERKKLGGRCGACEFNPLCGGCRARAYGVTGDYLAEDPLCGYTPGKFSQDEVVSINPITYGQAHTVELQWEEAAKERMKRIPAFVRGMVLKSVETYCKQNGVSIVTVDELEQIRARMPTQKLFRAS